MKQFDDLRLEAVNSLEAMEELLAKHKSSLPRSWDVEAIAKVLNECITKLNKV